MSERSGFESNCGQGSRGFGIVCLPEIDHVSEVPRAVGDAARSIDADPGFAQAAMDVSGCAQVVVALNQNRMLRSGEVPAQLPGGMQELSGVAPGQQVIANALEFQNTVQQ